MEKLFGLSVNGNTVNPPDGIKATSAVSLDKVIQVGVGLIILVGISIALIYLVQAGIQWIVSGGDKQRIEQARLRLVYGIVGLAIILGSFFIVNIFFGFFDISFAR